MNPENLPKPEPEQYDPNLEAQDEEVVSGGNNRLMYILVALVLALVLGYVALPKGQGSSIAAATPSFMLDDAAVAAPTAATAAVIDSAATDGTTTDANAAPIAAKANPGDEAKAPAKTVEAASIRPGTAASVTPAAPVTPVLAAVTAAGAAAAAPESVPALVATAAPVPVAPAIVTMSGKIEDENGRPLAGATVLLKGSSKGTSTDSNGNYTLEVPGGNNENTLVYGYGGYDDETVRSSGSKPVNVILTPRAKVSRRR